MGGKFKLLPQIIELLPDNINTFVDLFGGGFNVGSNVNAQKIIYNDKCAPVKAILKCFYKNTTDYCLNTIDSYINEYELTKDNNEGYLIFRSDYNNSDNKSPLMLYTLICYAFNNQIRFNSKGDFNMPFGKNRSSFNPSLRQKFIDFCENLHNKNCIFTSLDFRDAMFFIQSHYGENDFIYCDPPYFNSTASYNEQQGWTEDDENSLLKILVECNNKSIKWALSNNLKTNPKLKDWAGKNGFIIHYLNGDYKNCNYHKKDRTKDIEVLITNY